MGESADTVRERVQNHGYAWTFVLDSDEKVARTYNVPVTSSISVSVFIDAKGVIVRWFSDGDYETFLKAAREAIGD